MDILYQLRTVRPMGLSILPSSESRSSRIRASCDWNTMTENNKSTTKTQIDPNKINMLVASPNISTVNSIESTDIREETSVQHNEDTRFDVSSTMNNVEVNSSPNTGKRFCRTSVRWNLRQH